MFIVCNVLVNAVNYILIRGIGKLLSVYFKGIVIFHGCFSVFIGIHPVNPFHIRLWNLPDFRLIVILPSGHHQQLLAYRLNRGQGRFPIALCCQQAFFGIQNLHLSGKTIGLSGHGSCHSSLRLQNSQFRLLKLQLVFLIIDHIGLSHCNQSFFSLFVAQIDNLAVFQVLICLFQHVFRLNFRHQNRIDHHAIHHVIGIWIINAGIDLLCHLPVFVGHIFFGIPVLPLKFIQIQLVGLYGCVVFCNQILKLIIFQNIVPKPCPLFF